MDSPYSQKDAAGQPLFCAGRPPRQTTRRRLRVERSQISYLRFIFEAYDGIAVVRTTDAARGEIVLHVAPGCEDVVEMVLADLSKDLLIEPVLK
jgi:hypothetical protein